MSTETLTKNTYSIDAAHSAVRFQVKHMMISKVHGHINGITGTVRFDPSDPEVGEAEVSIPVENLTTGQDQRDAHLKSADFFDVDRFPNITFETTRIARNADGDYDVFGDLTMHGVTKELKLIAELSPEVKNPQGGYAVGVNAKGVVNREDFGMMYNMALETGGFLVGKEIQLEIDVELGRPE